METKPVEWGFSKLGRDQNSAEVGDYVYDETFYRYIEQGATRSAQVIVPLVIEQLKVDSLLDVGCGAGAWLAEYRRQGVPICVGVDGDYVKPSSLLVSGSTFVARDVAKPFDLGQRFDVVQCLEVGEHLEPLASRTLVRNLVQHGDMVVFSAAIPGQGGENHINEQPYEFWRTLFAEHGYFPYDFLRPLLINRKAVEIWYRNNMMLYVADSSRTRLLPVVAQTRVPNTEAIRDVASASYKLRTRILAVLAVKWLSRLAVLKHRCILLVRVVTGRRV
jgi:SAM-dependent methyltransferase